MQFLFWKCNLWQVSRFSCCPSIELLHQIGVEYCIVCKMVDTWAQYSTKCHICFCGPHPDIWHVMRPRMCARLSCRTVFLIITCGTYSRRNVHAELTDIVCLCRTTCCELLLELLLFVNFDKYFWMSHLCRDQTRAQAAFAELSFSQHSEAIRDDRRRYDETAAWPIQASSCKFLHSQLFHSRHGCN